MEKGYTKVNDNIYFRSRKEAAMYDERLSSRERASELLGVSVSSLADYELGTLLKEAHKYIANCDFSTPQERRASAKWLREHGVRQYKEQRRVRDNY